MAQGRAKSPGRKEGLDEYIGGIECGDGGKEQGVSGLV